MDLANILTVSLILNAFFFFATLLFPNWLKIAFSKSLLIVVRNDRVVDITNAKYDGGLLINKKYGVFVPEQDDVLIFNKKPCVIVSNQYTKPVRVKVMPILRKLKNLGIETYDDFKQVLYLAKHHVNGGELNPNIAKAVEFIRELENNNALHDSENAVRVSDLVNYLEEQNPAILEGIIERRVKQETRKLKSPLMNFMPYVIMFLMILIGGAIAWKIVSSGGVSAVQNTVSNLPINVK